jgi:hypothetical protein
MQRFSLNNDTTDYIPNAWLNDLRRDNLAGVALRGPGKSLINIILKYSRQLFVSGSITKIIVNLN